METNKQLKEEFIKEFSKNIGGDSALKVFIIVADWWLSKLAQALQSQRKNLVEKGNQFKYEDIEILEIQIDHNIQRKMYLNGIADYQSLIKQEK